MKANGVGQRVTGKFLFRLYLEQKYEGFWPANMPTRREIADAKRANPNEYHKLQSKYNGVMKEWMRLQQHQE